MRLLQLRDDSFVLVDCHRDVPPYAILSHTWGPDHEEVTFTNIIDGTGTHKAGFEKLHFCARQAAKDGLEYFWVDTCCIDKSSSAELSEAINSMFAYYEGAATCYAYLTDVTEDADSIEKSRWFTRGWTLQELVAPKTVKFFNGNCKPLGDRMSLMPQILRATNITAQVLGGCPVFLFYNIDERVRWAKGRETKRPEDSAYCLLGLCDVQIPPIYGEGRDKAFRRLRKETSELSAGQPPHDFLFRFVRNNWPQSFAGQHILVAVTDSETSWHAQQKRLLRAVGLLKAFLAADLFIAMMYFSVKMDTSTTLSTAVKLWGSAGIALVYFCGMALLFRPRSWDFKFAIFAYFAFFRLWLMRLYDSLTSLHWRTEHPGTVIFLQALRRLVD